MKKKLSELNPNATFFVEGIRYKLGSRIGADKDGREYYYAENRDNYRQCVFPADTEAVEVSQNVLKRVECQKLDVGDVFVAKDRVYVVTRNLSAGNTVYLEAATEDGWNLTLRRNFTVVTVVQN